MGLSTEQICKALAQSQVLCALNEVDLKKVANLTQEKTFSAGTTIFEEGTPAEELLVVLEGKIALQMSLVSDTSHTTRRITVDIINPNQIIGWSALVEPHVITLTSVCLQMTRVLSVDAIRLRSLLSSNHHIGYQVMSELIKVVASRLDDTRRVLVSERLLPLTFE